MEFLKPLADYYYFFYWLIVMIMTFSQFHMMKASKGFAVLSKRYNYRPILLFTIFYIIFFGFRPIAECFGDTINYRKGYEFFRDFGVFMNGDEIASNDVIFYTFEKICAKSVDIHVWFAIIMLFYMMMMLGGCKKIDYRHGALLMLFCLGSFEFYPYSVNGIRNGVACSFAIMAVACLCKEEKIWALIWSIIAVGCHKSTALPIATVFFSYYVSKPKFMYITWLGAIVLSLAIGGSIDNLLSSLSYDDRLSDNLRSDSADGLILKHSFRWDFLLYSFMPILLGWYTIFKRKLFNKTYLILLGTYMYANAFWIFAIRAIFSNRIAYLSWFIYPIVLAYPLLNFPVFKKNHTVKTAWILLGQFGFTTILAIIYYSYW